MSGTHLPISTFTEYLSNVTISHLGTVFIFGNTRPLSKEASMSRPAHFPSCGLASYIGCSTSLHHLYIFFPLSTPIRGWGRALGAGINRRQYHKYMYIHGVASCHHLMLFARIISRESHHQRIAPSPHPKILNISVPLEWEMSEKKAVILSCSLLQRSGQPNHRPQPRLG